MEKTRPRSGSPAASAIAPPEPTVSSSEAARLLGVSVRTVQLWLGQGKLQGWRTAGGHRRVYTASLQPFLGQSAAPPRDGLRLLIVEDDPDLLELYVLTIASWGLALEVRTAGNGVDALLMLGQWRPDVLLTDLDMPAVDGVQMIRSLRASADHAALRILVVTGLDAAAMRRLGTLPADVPVMRKPLSFDWLRGFLEASLLCACHD
ncbi:response regulator [Chitinimonas koreensis]|uniref:response regulator n=1 Tax=Chitinimonas koreensis TaxID=356302 RepID=UPI0009FDF2B2|nr:response regulator [Chitinimonas koreensis]QNM98125.1 response regulator [Chitinimonas koreensis]